MDPWLKDIITTIGPVGLFAVALWYLWLKYGGRRGGPSVSIQEEMHQDNRDKLRDVLGTTSRIEKMSDRTLEHLGTLVNSQVRIAEILERIEGSINIPSARRRRK